MRFSVNSLFVVILFLFGSSSTFGQCTPNNSHTAYGAYTSLGKNKIPNCWIDSAFEENVTIVVPSKYEFVNITEIRLLEVIGLYTGLSYDCNPSNCVFPAGSNHCIKITGTPTDIKQTNQDSVWLSVRIINDLIPEYYDTVGINFNLLDSSTLSISAQKEPRIELYPNPVNDNIYLNVGNNSTDELQLDLIDINGRIVKQTVIKNNTNNNAIPVSNLENGVYFLRFELNDKNRVEKIIIQH